MIDKLNIRDVFFMKPGPWGLVRVFDEGIERLDLLRRFFRRESLGDYVLFAWGHGPVKHEEIDWSTAGRLITADGREQPRPD